MLNTTTSWIPSERRMWARNSPSRANPMCSAWLNRIEVQFQALRYFTLDGADHGTHAQQALMIRSYIRWRNRHAATRHSPQRLVRSRTWRNHREGAVWWSS
jgi:hypothetical protein